MLEYTALDNITSIILGILIKLQTLNYGGPTSTLIFNLRVSLVFIATLLIDTVGL